MLRTLGAIHDAQGQRFRAAMAYAQAVRVDPQQLEGYVLLGKVRFALGEVQAAQEAFRQAILIEPDYYDARFELARVLLESRVPLGGTAETGDAAASPQSGTGTAPPSGIVPSPPTGAVPAGTANVAPAVDPLAQASEHITEARRIRPDAQEAVLLHAKVLVAQGHLADAQFVVEQALQGSPRQPGYLRALLHVQRQRADWPEVKRALDRLEAAGPLTPEDQTVRADYMEGTGDETAAAALRADLVRGYPKDPAVLVAGARGLLALNQPREALRAAEGAVREGPKRAEAHYWKAVAHYALGQNLDGDLALNRAEALEGGNPAVRLLRIRRLLSERRLGEAAPRMQLYVTEFPADRAGLLLQAELATLSGDHQEADRLLGLLPSDGPGVRFAQARLDYLRGRYANAAAALAPLTARSAPPWEAVYLEASAMARLGHGEAALGKILPFLDREAGGPAFARLAGTLAIQQGDARAAERFYQQGLRKFPRDAGLLEGASRLAMEREDWRNARLWLEAGSERPGPFQAVMLERLVEVYRKLGEADRARAARQRYLDTIDPLVREGREATETAILYRMTLPTLGLAIDKR
jgi:tetratricopeptide (TPR) repeat protein